MSFEYIFEKFFDFEKLFRELATNVQLGKATWRDVVEGISKGWDIVRDIEREVEYLESQRDLLTLEERAVLDQVKKILDNVKEILNELSHERLSCMGMGLSPRECETNYFSIFKLENSVMEFTGNACAFKVSNSFVSKINDLSACVHRFAEVGSTEFGKWSSVYDKCYFAPNASNDLKEFCIKWSRNSDILYRNGLYDPGDYHELRAWVIGNRIYLRVGSAKGHATEIDLDKQELKYYDKDESVINILKQKFEQVELKCENFEFGMVCKGVTKDKLDKIAKILPFATSMDFRLGALHYYTIPMIKYTNEYVKKLFKKK